MHVMPLHLSIGIDEHNAFVLYAFCEAQNLVLPIQIPEHLLDIGTRLLGSATPVYYDDPHELGRELGAVLYPTEVQDLLQRAAAGALRSKRRVQILLQIAVPELAALPWEWATIAASQPWAPARSDEFPVVRHSAVVSPAPTIAVEGPLRLLVCVGEADVDALQLLHSLLSVEITQQRISIDIVVVSTSTDIDVALRRNPPHIIHFVAGVTLDADQVVTMHYDAPIDIDELQDLLQHYPTIGMVVITPVGPQSAQLLAFPQICAALLLNRTLVTAIAFGGMCRADVITRYAATCYNAIIEGIPIDLAVTRARRVLGTIDIDPLWGYPQLRMVPGAEHVFAFPPVQARADWLRSAGLVVLLICLLLTVTILGRFLGGGTLPRFIQSMFP
jgi:hypothetical protein